MSRSPAIVFIDQTLREGMQYRGLVFNSAQRQKILEFQEALGVDICQAGYPSAHPWEAEQVARLHAHAQKHGFAIRVAALGRALVRDVEIMAATGIRDFHLHAHIPAGASPEEQKTVFAQVAESVSWIRERSPMAEISLAMLDVGRTAPELLAAHLRSLADQGGINILSLPDTSGMMAPNLVFNLVRSLAGEAEGSGLKLSTHCHNDMGMASANTIMGVIAGATVVEATALGIGERNGLADLFTIGHVLRGQGFPMRMLTRDMAGFKAYYSYVNSIIREQTGEDVLAYTTPFFGDAVQTHVAGTHAGTAFGISKGEQFYLNILCGRNLVKKYLDSAGIPYLADRLSAITEEIKTRSAELGRSLEKGEISAIAGRAPGSKNASG